MQKALQSTKEREFDVMKKALLLLQHAVTLAETGLAKTRHEIMVQKVILAARANGGIQRRDALRLTHLTAAELDQVIITAVERGELRVEKEKGITWPAIYYRAARLLPKEGD